MAKKYSKRSTNKDYIFDLRKLDDGGSTSGPSSSEGTSDTEQKEDKKSNVWGVVGGLTGMTGQVVSSQAGSNKAGNITGGAMQGAGAGAALGPFGIAGGAIIGGVAGLLGANAKKRAEQEAKYQEQVAQSLQADQIYKSQLKNQQANIPTFLEGGEITSDINTKAEQQYRNVRLPAILPSLKERAELNYYANKLNEQLKTKDSKTYSQISVWNPEKPLAPKTRIAASEKVAKTVPNFYLSPEEQQKTLGESWKRYVELRGKYGKDLNLLGEGDDPTKPDTWKVGARHAAAFNPAGYTYMFKPESAEQYTNKFNYQLEYNPTQEDPYIVTKDERFKFNPEKQDYESFRCGGKLHKKAEGGYTIDYKGASHADGGIPVDGKTGNPTFVYGGKPDAEVEGSEMATKFPGEETPYIFSHKLGFADKARKIVNKYSRLRPNEKISQDTMYMELGGLMSKQEEFRKGLDEHMESIEYGEGGKIHIKPENKGKFTAWAKSHGMGVQEAAHHVMAHKDKYSSTIIKRANFARNASKWKHELGGNLEQFKLGGKPSQYGEIRSFQRQYGLTDDGIWGTQSEEAWNKYGNEYSQMMGFKPQSLGTPQATASTPPSTGLVPMKEYTNSQEQYEPYRGSNLPLYMGIGTGLANLGLAASVKTPKDITPVTINPGKIDSNPMRRDILENAARSRANRLAALRGSGLSQAQYIAALSTGDSDINQATANAIRQNEFETQMKNIAMNQSAQEANAKAINETNLYNAQQKYGAQQQRRSYITNALQSAGQGVQSYMSQREAIDIANAMSPYMQIVKDKYGNIRRVPKTGI